MRPNPNAGIECFRTPYRPEDRAQAGTSEGRFCVPKDVVKKALGPHGRDDILLVSDGCRVAVRLRAANRFPTFEEMELVRALFYAPGETVIQIHPGTPELKAARKPFTLQLWGVELGSETMPKPWHFLDPTPPEPTEFEDPKALESALGIASDTVQAENVAILTNPERASQLSGIDWAGSANQPAVANLKKG